jgi:hypothetical protein
MGNSLGLVSCIVQRAVGVEDSLPENHRLFVP